MHSNCPSVVGDFSDYYTRDVNFGRKFVYMTQPNILSESHGRQPTYRYGGWYCTMQTLPQFVHHASLNPASG